MANFTTAISIYCLYAIIVVGLLTISLLRYHLKGRSKDKIRTKRKQLFTNQKQKKCSCPFITPSSL